MTVPPAWSLPIAVRAYAPRPRPKRRNRYRSRPRALPPSDYSLTFDCETTDDRCQRLRFGAFQVRHAGEVIRAGFFYDPAGLSDQDLQVLRTYAYEDGFELLVRDRWVEEVFFRYVSETPDHRCGQRGQHRKSQP